MQSKNKWEPPKGNLLKVNFDGATSNVRQIGATGMVIHNTKCELIAIRSNKWNTCSPLLIESAAALLALRIT